MPPATTLGAGEKKDARFSKSARKEYDKREKLILEELATLNDHEWSGEYSYGNGLSKNQRLLFVFSTAGPVPAVGWKLSTCFVSECKGREK